MIDGRDRVLLNKKLADQSAAYLAMWKALESFDQKADRWAEPISFGSREERAQAAHNAIARFRERHLDAVDKEMERDIQTFEVFLQELSSGASYDAAVDQFCWRLRDRGSALADQSVTVARTAP